MYDKYDKMCSGLWKVAIRDRTGKHKREITISIDSSCTAIHTQ